LSVKNVTAPNERRVVRSKRGKREDCDKYLV